MKEKKHLGIARHKKLLSSKVFFCLLTLLMTGVCAVLGGCAPTWYRQRADRQVTGLVDNASQITRDPLCGFAIDIDPSSRMFDPFCPDHEPVPVDDPAAHRYMECVDGMWNFHGWERNGVTTEVENPYWQCGVQMNDRGEIILDEAGAMRLALVNSPDYQEVLEDLYFSALDVSFERFRFDSQFYGGYEVDFTADGKDRGGVGGNSSSILSAATFPAGKIRMEKLYAAGGELVVGLANSLIWQFSSSDDYTATTLLDFAFVQPLLRGGGRRRVLENLTQSERDLLYDVRDYERFRREFFVWITTGRSIGSTGISVGGFIGLVEEQQVIRNREANIASLRSSLAQLEAFFAAGRIDLYQVQLARQALYNSQSSLLRSKTVYETTLDRFKMSMGLPPDVPMTIDNDLLDRFDLIDPEISNVQNRLTDIQQSSGGLVIALLQKLESNPNIGPQIGNNPATAAANIADIAAAADDSEAQADADSLADVKPRELIKMLKAQVEETERLRAHVLRVNVPRAWKDVAKLRETIPGRVKDLRRLREQLFEQLNGAAGGQSEAPGDTQPVVPPEDIASGILDVQKLQELPASLDVSMNRLIARLKGSREKYVEFYRCIERIEKGLDSDKDQLDIEALVADLRRNFMEPFPNELTELTADVLELTLVQARAKTETITLDPVDMASETAIDIALENRRDWKNAQGELVDSWRAIGVRRNDLRSGLDIVFAGDISNKNSSAFDLRDSTGRLKVGVQFDAPLTRLIERNDYRKALIEYQQARRAHYQAEDMITRDLRSILRNIDLNELNFEIQRAAIHVAIAQVELARLKLQEPPKPNQSNSFGATTARDLVTALSSLLNAQNQFVNIWVNYESLRRSLDLDMGTMQLDPEGMWVEPGEFDYGSSNEKPPVDPLMKPLVSEVVPDITTEPAVVGPPRPVTEAAEIVPQMVELVQPLAPQ